MTLKMLFFLDASSNKYIMFEIMALIINKKSLKPNKKLKEIFVYMN